MAFFSDDKDNGGKGIDGLKPENLFKEAEKKKPGILAQYAKAIEVVVKEREDKS